MKILAVPNTWKLFKNYIYYFVQARPDFLQIWYASLHTSKFEPRFIVKGH